MRSRFAADGREMPASQSLICGALTPISLAKAACVVFRARAFSAARAGGFCVDIRRTYYGTRSGCQVNIASTYIRPAYLPGVRKRGLSDAQAARVLSVLRRRLAEVHGGNQVKLATELGIAPSSLWLILNERTSASLATAEALAHRMGVDVESILGDPRDIAARICRTGGVPEPAIRRVLEEPPGDAPRPVLYWIDKMRAAAVFFSAPDATPPPSARTAAGPHDSQTMPVTPRPTRTPRAS